MDLFAFQWHETSLVDLFTSQLEWNWFSYRYLGQKKQKNKNKHQRYQYYLINIIILIKISAPESIHWPSLPPSPLTNWDFKNACIFTKYIPVTGWVFTQNASTSEISTILSTYSVIEPSLPFINDYVTFLLFSFTLNTDKSTQEFYILSWFLKSYKGMFGYTRETVHSERWWALGMWWSGWSHQSAQLTLFLIFSAF